MSMNIYFIPQNAYVGYVQYLVYEYEESSVLVNRYFSVVFSSF
jgi:hypothetical protein